MLIRRKYTPSNFFVSGGAALFDPSQLTGILAWYKADTGVFSDLGVTPATNSTTVEQWNDQSGNNFHLLQGGAGSRPTFLSAGFNTTKPTVQLAAASSTGMFVATFPIGTGNTGSAFAVCQMLPGTSTYGRLISYAAPAQSDFSGAGSASWILRDAGNNGFATFQASSEIAIQSISTTTNYRLGMIFDGVNVTSYINNVGGTPAVNSHNWATNGVFSIGGDSGSFWDGPVSEIVITTSALSNTERTNLDNYFITKWGL